MTAAGLVEGVELVGVGAPVGDVGGGLGEPEVVVAGVGAKALKGLAMSMLAAWLILPLACSITIRLLRAWLSWRLRVWASTATWCWMVAMVTFASRRLGVGDAHDRSRK